MTTRTALQAQLLAAEARSAQLRREFFEAERVAFALKPWDYAPMDAAGNPPTPRAGTNNLASWRRARAILDQLLDANPDHYQALDEVEDELDRLRARLKRMKQ